MEIRILQAGEQLGPFSERQVRQYLGEGLISTTDLAIYEGLQDWQSLDVVLANLPPAPDLETITPDVPPPGSPFSTSPAPQPPLAMPNDAPETLELAPAPPAAEPVLPLTASQKTKRKLNKIVIQPILPLETAAPTRKKTRSGKTALTLEPLRPTTSLPPITEFTPKEKKPGRNLIRTGPVTLRDFPEKPVAAPVETPAPEPIPAPLPPSPPEPAYESAPPPPLLLSPLEIARDISVPRNWSRRLPRETIFAGAGLAFLVLCVFFSYLYHVIAETDTSPTTSLGTQDNAAPAPTQAETQNPDAVPKTAEDFRNRGLVRQSTGDLDGAIQDFDQAVSLDPKDAEALYRRGLAREAKGDMAGALADYTEVLGINPKQADAYSNRGFVKQARGDTDGALADYTQALLINPKIPVVYYNEGLIDVQKGDLDSAIASFDRSIDLDPKMALAYYNRGNAKNGEGNLDGAVADYTQALILNPKIASAYYKRGLARQTKGDADGALADYTQAVALDPKMGDAFHNRGVIKMGKGDLDGAIADSTQAITLDPKNGQAYHNRGLARLGKNDLDGAMSDLKTFCQLAPNDTDADSARIYLWLLSTEENPQGAADQDLAASLQNEWNSPPEDLTSKIAAFLLGHIHENDLIANAATPDPSREPGQYCRVWYFAGMKRLLGGDMTTAIAYFQKCLATKQQDYCEYIFAQAELQALGQNREVASKPEPGP
ncbi:MAG: tetratricopeptide repeat protein [Methylacidiphilales bacterium]|nr:tetratricopeptide repeat protein [Candidatus Methylacidiphilales bacterium]